MNIGRQVKRRKMNMNGRVVSVVTIMLMVMAAPASLPAAANTLVFVAMTPCRVVDTRAFYAFPGAFGAPSLVGGATRTFPIRSSSTCAIPAAAQAYSFNITVVPPGPLGYITAYPTGQTLPLAATVNSPQGYIVGNGATLLAGTNGSIDIYATNPTDIVIDINGYYVSASAATGDPTNTNLGVGALANNTSGGANTAIGNTALNVNTTGMYNTAVGAGALFNNTNGGTNTAIGVGALSSNSSGTANTAVGDDALSANTTGQNNTATGTQALVNNSLGTGNTANGYFALEGNTTGSNNLALGIFALEANATGNNNIAIGNQAASLVHAGSNNIHIGNKGVTTENNTIRIGTTGVQTSFLIAGVRGTTTGSSDAVPVLIDSNGQLGTVSSSRRFKEDIENMGEASRDLMRLRPVTFRYQKPFADGSKPIQYGLIAEEVADVYPDLVAHSADGQIETVKYQVLDAMLLNELQKERQQVEQQAETIRVLENRLTKLELLLSGASPR